MSTPRTPMIRETAPAKVNLILHVGPRRADGLHDLCSLFASLDLADRVTVEVIAAAPDRPVAAGPDRRAAGAPPPDEILCPGVTGPNLAAAGLSAFRAAAPHAQLPPLRVTIEKRIPVAAGLGGGSADAAAVLRAANRIAGDPFTRAELRAVGFGTGADVPSQVEPQHALVTGAGEGVERIDLPDMALLLVPAATGLSTADVYAAADRLPSTRPRLDPDRLRRLASAPLATLARAMENDLEAAALSLRPDLARTLATLEEAGALAARISGSGPTAFGVYATPAEAEAAAELFPDAIVTRLRQPDR
jgi:4-diphosphocytidyl-2-C-methyl-D-erythritol kinase